jgi:C1A family cysteine protease
MPNRPPRPLGWIRDLPDKRDYFFRDRNPFKTYKLPTKVDLRDKFDPIADQGNLGSCTANAASDALEYLDAISNRSVEDYSRLFIYYNSRWFKNSDTGATIRDTYKSMATYGACHETTWPYEPNKFADKPTDASYSEGELHQALEYSRVVQGPEIKQVLAEGFPIEFGFTVYESFYDIASDGIMPEPSGSAEGGHAVLIVGFDEVKQLYTIRNSWGESFGDKGYFYASYSFIHDAGYCSDFWVVRKMETGEAPEPTPTPSPTPRPSGVCNCANKIKKLGQGKKPW